MKNKSLYSLFHESTKKHYINQIHQYFINRKVHNLRKNKVTKDDIISMEAELKDSPALFTDLPLLVTLFSIIAVVVSNLYLPYINSLLPQLLKEEHEKNSSDTLQTLYTFQTCVRQLQKLQQTSYYMLVAVVIIVIIKAFINMNKKLQLEALHEYERQLPPKKVFG